MIIYNREKYEGAFPQENVGIVGENLVNVVDFMVKNFSGENISASVHLRFADGSVNSVVPQNIEITDEGTHIIWTVRKNDIFCHGWVEVQLELREGETLLQTEIVRLFAGESLPVEDREYSNPNSETLALRDEVKKLWEMTAEQNTIIERNIGVIEQSDISLKEDRKNKAVSKADVTAESYPSVQYINNYYYDSDEIDEQINELDETVTIKINLKADKATTLAGYGIEDAYNKTYLDKALRNKLDKMPFDTVLAENSPNYVTSGTVYSAVNALSQTVAQNKSVADTALATKAELIKSKNIFDFDKWAKGLQNLASPVYRGNLNNVDFEEKSITFTSTDAGAYTNGWTSNPAEMNIAVEPNTVYTFSWNFNGSDSTQIFLFFNGINTAETRLSKSGKTGYITFTTLEDTSYITVRFDALLAGTTVTVSDIMIEEGEKSLLYIPYEVAEGVNELDKSTETVLSEVKNTLALKYDSSNVEKGSGTLSPATGLNTGNEGSFIYSKNGNTVTVGVNMTKFLAEKSEAKMSGLPFKADLSVRMSSIIAKTSTGDLCNVRVDGTWLYFTKTGSTFTDSEALTATVTYII